MVLPRKRLLLFLVVISVLCGPLASAQEPATPPQESPQPLTVKMNVIVTDNANKPFTDLKQEDFRISEEGKPQTITYFSKEDVPLSYGLVVDASGSQRTLISEIINAGKQIIQSNKPSDETFVVRFVDTDNIQVEQGFTSDQDVLSATLDEIYVEGGLTAVIDAVNQSADYLKKSGRNRASDRREAIILITDGEDRGSRTHADALLNRLRETGVQFFIIGLTKLSDLKSAKEKAVLFLTQIATVTGGRVFFPKSREELPAVVDEIIRILREQYVLGYVPTNAGRNGSFRKVQISLSDSPGRKKLNVIAKPGYAAPRQ